MLFAGAASVTTHIHMAAEFQAQTCVYVDIALRCVHFIWLYVG